MPSDFVAVIDCLFGSIVTGLFVVSICPVLTSWMNPDVVSDAALL